MTDEKDALDRLLCEKVISYLQSKGKKVKLDYKDSENWTIYEKKEEEEKNDVLL